MSHDKAVGLKVFAESGKPRDLCRVERRNGAVIADIGSDIVLKFAVKSTPLMDGEMEF